MWWNGEHLGPGEVAFAVFLGPRSLTRSVATRCSGQQVRQSRRRFSCLLNSAAPQKPGVQQQQIIDFQRTEIDVLAVFSVSDGKTPNEEPTATIRFLSAIDGSEVQPTLPTSNRESFAVRTQAEYSPDGKRLAVLQAYNSGIVQLVVFDLATRKRLVENGDRHLAGTRFPGPCWAFGSEPVPVSEPCRGTHAAKHLRLTVDQD